MTKKPYCTQNNSDCPTCSLVNYGLDCQNNPIGQGGPGRGQGRKHKIGGAMPTRAIRMTDDEYIKVKKYLAELRKK